MTKKPETPFEISTSSKLSLAGSGEFGMNDAGTCWKSGTRLTHACSRVVRRQLLHLSSVYLSSSVYYREALRPVIRKIISQLETQI